MNIFDKALLFFVLGAIATMCWFILAAVRSDACSVTPEPKRIIAHLPTTCAPFYNDGTDRWIECMGVGYK